MLTKENALHKLTELAKFVSLHGPNAKSKDFMVAWEHLEFIENYIKESEEPLIAITVKGDE